MAFSFDLGLAISAERYGAISAGPEHLPVRLVLLAPQAPPVLPVPLALLALPATRALQELPQPSPLAQLPQVIPVLMLR